MDKEEFFSAVITMASMGALELIISKYGLPKIEAAEIFVQEFKRISDDVLSKVEAHVTTN